MTGWYWKKAHLQPHSYLTAGRLRADLLPSPGLPQAMPSAKARSSNACTPLCLLPPVASSPSQPALANKLTHVTVLHREACSKSDCGRAAGTARAGDGGTPKVLPNAPHTRHQWRQLYEAEPLVWGPAAALLARSSFVSSTASGGSSRL